MKVLGCFKAYIGLALVLWKIPLQAGWLGNALTALLLLSPVAQVGVADDSSCLLGKHYERLHPDDGNSALPRGLSYFLTQLDVQDEVKGCAAAARYKRACFLGEGSAAEPVYCKAFRDELARISRGQERFGDGVPEADAQAYGRWLNRADGTMNLIRTIGEERTAELMMQVLTGDSAPTWDYSGIDRNSVPILEQFGIFRVDPAPGGKGTVFPVRERIDRLEENLQRAMAGQPLDGSREALYAELIMKHRTVGLIPYDLAFWYKRRQGVEGGHNPSQAELLREHEQLGWGHRIREWYRKVCGEIPQGWFSECDEDKAGAPATYEPALAAEGACDEFKHELERVQGAMETGRSGDPAYASPLSGHVDAFRRYQERASQDRCLIGQLGKQEVARLVLKGLVDHERRSGGDSTRWTEDELLALYKLGLARIGGVPLDPRFPENLPAYLDSVSFAAISRTFFDHVQGRSCACATSSRECFLVKAVLEEETAKSGSENAQLFDEWRGLVAPQTADPENQE